MSVLSELKAGYNFNKFQRDLIAAISVLILLVPQGLAYGVLAGFPAISGLYAAVVALLVYPLFASSKQLSVGPVALTSIILFAGLSPMAAPESAEFIRLGLIVGLMSGIVQLLLSFFKLGIIVNFLSSPVISGFISAAAIIICFNQLDELLGISVASGSNFLESTWAKISHLSDANLWSSIIGIISILVILTLKRISRKIPSSLIVFAIATSIVYLTTLQDNLEILGEIQGGLPSFQIYKVDLHDLKTLWPLSVLIALISFVDSSAIARKLASESQDHRVNPNKELLGLGMAKIVGSFFYAIPTSGSFGRSAVNRSARSVSQISSWMAAILLIICILFLTPIFYYTPLAVLAAIIISAVYSLVDIKTFREVFKNDKRDFYAMLACFAVTILLGIQEGILAGVFISLGLILWKTMRPHFAILGHLKDHDVYRNIDRFSEAISPDKTIILRFDDDLYFANADYFYDSITSEIEKYPETKFLILDLSSVSHVDSTGFETLDLLSRSCKKRGISMKFAGIKGPVRDRFEKQGYEVFISESDCYMSIEKAVESIKN